MVGIGASAGGVEALVELFKALPEDLDTAFVVALHTEPSSVSHLQEILGRASRMSFHVVEETAARVEPNQIYVALPGRMLTYRDGALIALDLEHRGVTSWPLDSLFLSLAQELGPRAVAVILSGTGSHGVAGAAHVRAEGGLVIAQDPKTATHDSMPRNAIHAKVADLVLAPADIPRAMASYLAHDHVGGESAVDEAASRHLETVLTILRARLRRDFRPYKRPTLMRRLRRRAGLNHCHGLDEYLELLRRDEDELRALAEDLTVRVTGFFRDPEAWRVVEEKVIPAIVESHEAGTEVRMWSAGCATGEEAYSLAMLVTEEVERVGKPLDVKVFATDTAEDALALARGGLYPEGAVEHLGETRLRRFFRAEASAYRVKKGLRDLVVVSPHNLLEAPPFSRMDLVSCRNLLIYLEPDVQQRVLGLLHFALYEGGYAFLGKAEAVSGRREFEPMSKKWRIYRKVGPTRHDRVEFPLSVPEPYLAEAEPTVQRGRRSRPERPDEMLRNSLLERYAPPSVLIDPRFQILYFHGPTEGFLRQPRGEPRQDLLAMAREGLRGPIRRAVRKALHGAPAPAVVTTRPKDGAPKQLRVVATSLGRQGDADAVVLVTFETVVEEPTGASGPLEREEDAHLEEVERELHDTREELRSVVEELETSNEELKASNEEITSMNEELQSTNEELETSKEELQSLNEELSTVNTQLENKLDELERTSNDLRNFLASADIATIFLDTELRIRLFTPPAVRLFNLRDSDTGRPLEDLHARLADPALMSAARSVLDSLVPVEAEVRGHDERWYFRRVLPYRSDDNRIEGVVVTFSDVTALKSAEEDLGNLNKELERRVVERTRHLQLLQDVAVIANAATSLERATEKIMARVCDYDVWVAGHVYRARESGTLEPGMIWYVHPKAAALGDAIRQSLGDTVLERGEGFPGQVLESGAARWTGGAGAGGDERVNALASAGIAAGISLPVAIGEEVVAVLEFFSEHSVDLDEVTLDVMVHVGTQLGRVLERARADRRLAELTLQEQQRLGEELHEGLGQQVTGVSMLARRLHQKLVEVGRPEAELAGELVDHMKAARNQVQDLAKGLIPVRVHERGLTSALQELMDHVCAAYRVDYRLDLGSVDGTDELVATSLYRIAREAVNNALLHASPGTVELRIARQDGALVLEVADDGDGFPGDGEWREGLGLKIMRDRAALVGGVLAIEANAGGGTRVRCTVEEGTEHGFR